MAPEQRRRRTLVVHDLGMVEYEDALALQRAFALARRGRVVPDILLLLEHPPVITLGRGAKAEHVRAAAPVLEELGVALHPTDRGGDVTYHGPGQVVGYPIVDLAPDRCDVRKYVGDIEETMIRAAAEFGVSAGRIEGWTGVWLGEKGKDARKLGAIGVHISRWITTHGFALNVRPNLAHFDLIVPCGIREAGVTSLEKELGQPPDLVRVKRSLGERFAERLDANVLFGRFDHRTVSVAVLRRAGDDFEALLLRRHPRRGGFWQPVTGTIEKREEPLETALRELGEETGMQGEVRPAGYEHSFLFGEPRPDKAPRIFHETAFWALVEGGQPVKMDAREHCECMWLPVDQALAKVPFIGLREALKRAWKAAKALPR